MKRRLMCRFTLNFLWCCSLLTGCSDFSTLLSPDLHLLAYASSINWEYKLQWTEVMPLISSVNVTLRCAACRRLQLHRTYLCTFEMVVPGWCTQVSAKQITCWILARSRTLRLAAKWNCYNIPRTVEQSCNISCVYFTHFAPVLSLGWVRYWTWSGIYVVNSTWIRPSE